MVSSGMFGLLAFTGPAAIGAIFSIAVATEYIVYSIPIAARYLGGKDLRPGPFSLGIMSKQVAATAVAWMVFIIIVFFPATPGPDASNMNYTVVVLGGTVVLSIIYCYFPKYCGVHWFKGPIANIDTVTDGPVANDSEQDVTDKR